jgi:tripartite-type tricarboxylate transporter receptor subunit TctC
MTGCTWKTLGLALGVAGIVLCTAAAGAGGEYPSKPIRLIVPFPAGASADLRTRRLAPLVSQRLKQQIVIDNRPGAAGGIGTKLAAKAAPDGYTATYIISTAVAVHPHMYRDAGFDPLKELDLFIVTLRAAPILVVKANSPIRSVRDLISQAKARPGKLTYGTSGPGSPQHLMGERLKKMAGIDIVAVPYKGDAPTLTDLMGGQIDMAFGFPLATMSLINAGKLRALAVTSGKRLPNLPATPTLAESGVPNYDETIWSGFAVPAGTPEKIVRRLHEAFRSAMLTPEFRQEVEQSGAEFVASTQEYAMQLMKSDHERHGTIVKDLNLQVE